MFNSAKGPASALHMSSQTSRLMMRPEILRLMFSTIPGDSLNMFVIMHMEQVDSKWIGKCNETLGVFYELSSATQDTVEGFLENIFVVGSVTELPFTIFYNNFFFSRP